MLRLLFFSASSVSSPSFGVIHDTSTIIAKVVASTPPPLVLRDFTAANSPPSRLEEELLDGAEAISQRKGQLLPQQQQQASSPPQIHNRQQITGANKILHGATLEHPSLRNKMRRYREAKRDDDEVSLLPVPQQPQQHDDGIKYVEVPSARDDVKRYVAVIQTNQQLQKNGEESNQSNYEPVTVRAWMMLVSSGNPIGNQASSSLSNLIASSTYDSVLLEMPGSTWWDSAIRQFEFVLVNEPRLKLFAERNPDRFAFEEHYFVSSSSCADSNHSDSSGGGSVPITVCAFPNLGKDAKLISPIPQPGIEDTTYSHLISFLRSGPKEQITQFWKLSAKTYIDELKYKHERMNENAGTWFSTNGMGVSWLHLRLDSVPKYYSYRPFTTLGV